MKRLFLLPVLMLLCFRLAYTQNYIPVSGSQLIQTIESINTGLDIRFEVDEKADVYAIDHMVSIDRIDVSPEGLYVVSGYLFPEKAIDFVALQIPIMMVDLSQPKAFNMATSVTQMLNWDKYPTYQTYLDMMAYFQTTYPNLCQIDTIMASTPGGRKILAARITSNVTQDKPEFFYSSTMHGDEVAGYYLMIRMIHHLLSNYGTDARITNIVDNIDLWICPNANPDGTYHSGDNTLGNNPVSTRTNYNGKDLNRNYPDPRTGNPTGQYAPIQPETYAFIDFAASRQFVMGANYHGGTEVVNYPWDAWTSSQKSHADKLWWSYISREYADTAQANSPSGYFVQEENGITNGGDWYVITGGRQDYMNW
ncbi:MAG: M14 family zinc carboxypeptidase, partial [Bacteroidales bacterium]|nr:M14 family zinc carboxypeptidase [Bacteroidales bacterium]